MNQLLDDLIKVMTLERLEMNLFRGQSRDIGSPQVFGGQVLGQALTAATATVENRMVHSLHAYFLRRGDFKSPIVYEVDRARDGNHFSTRRVVAIQHGAQIFNMSASFQTDEQGPTHQLTMPEVPAPEGLPELATYYRAIMPQLPISWNNETLSPAFSKTTSGVRSPARTRMCENGASRCPERLRPR